MSFAFGGTIQGQSLPSKPTAAKTAATDTNYDFKITEDAVLTVISIKDPDEALNGTEVAISVRSSSGKTLHDLPGGQCGGITVYFWNGNVPIPENSILRIILDGATASTPRIRVSVLKAQEADR